MKFDLTDDFLDDCQKFNLRFNCEDCAYFDPWPEQCVHGYPTEEHRRSFLEHIDRKVVFCKEFELL